MKSKIYCLILLCSFLGKMALAQYGCTDIYASNYNASATINDGSCVYPLSYSSPSLKCNLVDALRESSGIIYTDHQLWTENDGGNPNIFFRIDSLTGAVQQVVFIDNFPNVDWEDITADKDYIYMAETGNNDGTRKDLKILKIAKSDISSADTVHLNASVINISYSDQTSFASSSTHNFDCESIISKGDSLFLFSKNRGDFRTKLYGVSKTPGTYVLDTIASYYVGGLICGADYNANTDEIMLIGYSGAKTSFLWNLNDFKGNNFFSGNKRKVNLNSSKSWQTEAVNYISDSHLLISTESVGSNPAAIYNLEKDWNKSTSILAYQFENRYQVYPNPSKGLFYIKFTEQKLVRIELKTMEGKILFSQSLIEKDLHIDLTAYASGVYFLTINDQDGMQSVQKLVKY